MAQNGWPHQCEFDARPFSIQSFDIWPETPEIHSFFFQPFAKFVAKCGMIGIEFVTRPSMKNRAAVYAEEGKEYLGETMLT